MNKLYFLILLTFYSINNFAQSSSSSASRTMGNIYSTNSKPTLKILKAYPNPATTYIVFEFQRNYVNGLSLEIYNLPGKRVAQANNLANSTTIQLQDFYRGIYIYKLMDSYSKVLESGKFQVSK